MAHGHPDLLLVIPLLDDARGAADGDALGRDVVGDGGMAADDASTQTAPAATTAPSPTRTPSSATAFAPISTLSSMMTVSPVVRGRLAGSMSGLSGWLPR